jgi:flagellin-like hook-associated protein FlgL
MSNQLTILQTQVGNLDDINAESIATQLSSLQTQLETSYDLTSQLQKLNLAQYLPV